MTAPAITVLLPVYNGAHYLAAAIDSILQQTFTDFEFLIINDGSKDESAEILAQYDDPRMKIIHQKNMGLSATLNKGIELAQGKYIARQDQDDISLPTRLKKQFDYLALHPECALLGTHATIWANDLATTRHHCHPAQHERLSFELLFNNPFVHSSVMFNKQIVRELGGYSTDPERQPPEDFELWSRIAKQHKIANLPERLLVYREVATSMSRDVNHPFVDKLVTICAENIAHQSSSAVITRHMQDIAALTHSAYKRVSLRPNIKKMQAIIQQIGERLGKQDPEILQITTERLQILQHQFMQHKLNKVHLLGMAKKFYGLYKRAFKS